MGELIIRDLDDKLLVQLKRRAWEQGLPLHESLRRLIVASVERDYARDADVIVMPPLSRIHDSICAEQMDRADQRVSLHS